MTRKKQPRLTVVDAFDEPQCANIVRQLREMADRIEAEPEDDTRTLSIVTVQRRGDGEMAVYCWGYADRDTAAGLLARAIHEIC